MDTIVFNKNCVYCNKPLRARPEQNRYKDFEKRDKHLKCFKQIRSNPFLKKYCYNIEMVKSNKDKEDKTDCKDNWKINFGKHKDKTFRELLQDTDYCKWILEKDDFGNQKLYEYIKDNQADLI